LETTGRKGGHKQRRVELRKRKTKNKEKESKIWCSYCNGYKDYYFLGCEAV
jgi:hypothetical protein